MVPWIRRGITASDSCNARLDGLWPEFFSNRSHVTVEQKFMDRHRIRESQRYRAAATEPHATSSPTQFAPPCSRERVTKPFPPAARARDGIRRQVARAGRRQADPGHVGWLTRHISCSYAAAIGTTVAS